VDDLFAQRKAAGAKIVADPEDKSWKLCEFMAADFGGNPFVSSMISGRVTVRFSNRQGHF
jgi:hypothetical protein